MTEAIASVAALTLLKMYIYINGSFCWLVLALGVA